MSQIQLRSVGDLECIARFKRNTIGDQGASGQMNVEATTALYRQVGLFRSIEQARINPGVLMNEQ